MGEDLPEPSSTAPVPEGYAYAAKANEALQATIDALSEVNALDEIVPRVLEIVARTFGARSCAVYENSRAGEVFLQYWHIEGRTYLPSELAGVDADKFGLIPKLAAGFVVPDAYLGKPAEHSLGAVLLDHSAGTVVPEFDTFAMKNNWVRELNIGVGSGGIRTSTLCVYKGREENFSAEEISLAEALAKQLGVAVRTSRLAEQAREVAISRDRELQARRLNEFLVNTVDSFARGPDLPEVLQRLLGELSRTVGADHLFLFRHDPQRRMLTLSLSLVDGVIRRGTSGEELPLWAAPFPDDVSPAWRIMCKCRGLFTPENTPVPAAEFGWPGAFGYARRFGLSDMAHIVLFAGDVPLGSLGFGFRGGRVLKKEDAPFIEAAAQQAAVMIRMIDLSEEARQAAVAREREAAAEARAENLARTKDALRRTLDAVGLESGMARVPGQILAAITTQLEAESSALWLLDSNTGKFRTEIIFDQGQLHERTALEEGLDSAKSLLSQWGGGRDLALKQHIAEQRPVVYQVADLRKVNEEAFRYLENKGVKTLFGIPLILGGEIVGSVTIRFHSQRELSPEELELTQAMSHQATLAIRLTRLAARAGEVALSEERARFAREIHDTLAQGFTGILMQLGAASMVTGNSRDGIAPHLRAIAELARASLAEARRSVRALRPVASADCRLDRMLEKFVASARMQTGAEVSLQIQGASDLEACREGGRLPARVENELCRIAQEALNNVVKHSKAGHVAVALEFQPDETVRISVKDDGIGFDTGAKLPDERFGLVGMQERAASIGASFTIISEEGRGTQVVVQLTKGRV